MTTITPSRRERLRTATVAEIKDAGRRLLNSGGPSAITLRAIARDMGMTAPAIYRYFPSLEALVKDLCTDMYGELSAAIEAARTAIPQDRPEDRLIAMARAFRQWSITHRPEFSLMFGEPIPGVTALDEACRTIDEGVASLCETFVVEFVALWRRHQFPLPPAELLSERFADQLAPELVELSKDLPPGVLYLFLSGWVRLYGLVAMEIFGHLSWALTDVEAFFDAEIATFLHRLTGSKT